MPYVKKSVRANLYPELGPLHDRLWDEDQGPGSANYIITMLMTAWLGPDPSYADYNAAIGVLECAKMELYRRLVAPYEDRKIAENGDVYTERELGKEGRYEGFRENTASGEGR